MKKKFVLKLSTILLGVLLCLGFSKVQAAESIFSKIDLTRSNLSSIARANSLSTKYLGISKSRKSGNDYGWYRDTNGNPQKRVWKIVEYTSMTDSNPNFDNLYYCLNATRGFGANGTGTSMGAVTRDEYATQYEMNLENKNNISNLAGEKVGNNYNKILWILDKSYVPGKSSENDKENLLSNAYNYIVSNQSRFDSLSQFVKKSAINKIINKDGNPDMIEADSRLNMTDDDIEVAQQMAIWYYTNEDDSNYHLSAAMLPQIIIKGETLKGNFGTVTGYNVEDVYYGDVREWKMNALFMYLIDVANQNSNYSRLEPTLTLENTNKVEEDGEYIIVGPLYLKGENTDKISRINAEIKNVNSCILLDSSKNAVNGNNFFYVIGDKGFYLKFNKNDIKSGEKITLDIKYGYANKKLTFMSNSNDPNNTQPVVLVEPEEKEKNTTTDITINLTEIKVEKVWDDNNNQDGKRPTSIRVQLYENGVAKGDSVTLNANKLTHTWTGLLAGKTYTVKELDANGNIIENNGKYNNDYSTSYRVTGNTTTITNKHIPEVISKKVVKVWDDQNNQDGVRPNKVIVTLYKTINNVKEKAETVELSEPSWSYEWNNLTKYQDGKEIKYTVEEVIPDGYTVKYSEDTFTITNKYTPGTVSKTVTKEWVDNNNQDGIRADEVTVQLYANSVAKGNSIKLNKENSWTYTWAGLPEKENGKTITYEVKELKIGNTNVANNSAAGYTVDYSVNENNTTITNTHIPEKIFDLALRKFITNISEGSYNREPVVDTSTIATTGTATYKHTKTPLSVQVGDIVTYTIRVYNEGEKDGYVSEITDYLPEWLDFLPEDSLNQEYLWKQDATNTRKITTDITAKESATGENKYSNRENKQLLKAFDGGDKLDYIDVQIKCKVNEKAQVKQLITNIAEISGMQDENGEDLKTDRDSTKANVNLPDDKDLPNYKGNESNKNDLADKDYYYKGQEDDDDFEKLIVENFDLALRKFIVSVNDKELKNSDGTYVREPVVDTSKLGTTDENGKTITTATYNHPKTPVQVKKGDIITYAIRVYNEGTLAGFANAITDNIPEGLEFIEDSSINKSYAWELKDGKLVTKYLSDNNINNVINPITEAEDGTKTLSYKDVKVQFKVIAEPSKFAGETITNWAEIQEDSNNDIDSTPGNNNKEEDDIDYEPVELTYFDLSLRKFITKVNETEINNRVPEVDTSKLGTIDENGKKITTATYKHTKDPIALETGSTVIYTIRVYNEGTIDGYANEITDNIPEGLEYLPTDATNTEYKWTMLDETGNITQDVSKAKKITTNYLSEENDKTQIINKYDSATKTLSYKDVKVAFKVVATKQSDGLIVNTAEISKASDEDIDSTPGNNDKTEDDIDNEYVKVRTFDLSLKKWVTATKVTYDGKTKVTKTGFDENSTEMAKVDLVGKKLKKTTVKFVYSIKVLNEGEVAGYATEVKDYIPSGLEFKAEDNPDWTLQKDGTATTDKLKDTLLEPGQSAVVEITLTWKNSSSNMGVKTNWAEISADSGDDIDSTPNNNKKGEDDIDDASVILSIKTGSATMYITLTLISITILAGGTFLIKKHVMDK